MKKMFWETNAMFKWRFDLNQAKKMVGEKKLWRIDAIEMTQGPMGSWKMGRQDHFTVEAHTQEMAIGKFKTLGHMQWFVLGVVEEKVVG